MNGRPCVRHSVAQRFVAVSCFGLDHYVALPARSPLLKRRAISPAGQDRLFLRLHDSAVAKPRAVAFGPGLKAWVSSLQTWDFGHVSRCPRPRNGPALFPWPLVTPFCRAPRTRREQQVALAAQVHQLRELDNETPGGFVQDYFNAVCDSEAISEITAA